MNTTFMRRMSIMFLPVAYIATKPKVARATNALPQNMIEALSKRDADDHKAMLNEMVDNISKWCDPRFKQVVDGFRNREDILHELDFIRVMYDHKPLNPAQRMRLRSKILYIIEKEQELTKDEVDFLISVLSYYDCL